MYAKYVVLALCCALAADAQVILLGSCPDVTVEADFNATAYLGTWYEYARSFAVFQLGGKCVKAEYALADDGSVSVTNTQISALFGLEQTIEGSAVVVSDNGDAKLEVTFSTTPFPAPYWVLDTDYENYAVVWGCSDVTIASGSFAWILTREREPSAEVVETAYAVLDANNISRDIVSVTTQEGCTN